MTAPSLPQDVADELRGGADLVRQSRERLPPLAGRLTTQGDRDALPDALDRLRRVLRALENVDGT